jgi:hypothetical protein
MTAIAQALSAALLHFIWQGTLVAFLLWIALSMLRNRTADQRYAASCAALALMAALPALTAWMVYRQAAAVPISAAISAAVPAAIQSAAVHGYTAAFTLSAILLGLAAVTTAVLVRASRHDVSSRSEPASESEPELEPVGLVAAELA